MEHHDYVRVEFTCFARTRYGQELKIESKDSIVSCKLDTTPDEWPVWSGSLILERNQRFVYNYCIVDGDSKLVEPRVERSITPVDGYLEVEEVYGNLKDEENDLRSMQESFPSEKSSMTYYKNDVASTDLDTTPERKKTIHIVCFHLPVKLSQDPETKEWKAVWGESLIARSDNSVANDINTRWYGTVGEVSNTTDQDKIRQLLASMNCVPLFLPKEITAGAYLGYCKEILWPSFHNVDILDLTCACWQPKDAKVWNQSIAESWWAAYVEMNRTFFVHLVQMVGDDDIVWVHDYHLMLLPRMLSARDLYYNEDWLGEGDTLKKQQTPKQAQIIFFLHIPFPTSQIFRSLTHGSELLNGIVGAHVVGFHAFDHARHFLNACKRLMGLSHQTVPGGLTGIKYHGRTVTVVVRHVSIEPDHVSGRLHEIKTAEDNESFDINTSFYTTALKQHKVVFAGVDTCQRLSGIALKLLAFERFLWEYEHWRHKVALVQVGLVEEKRPADENRTSSEINTLVSRINDAFPGSVYYKEVSSKFLSLIHRLKLWLNADVLVDCSIREGLNLAPFEYIYIRQQNPGLVLASEFSATASLLNGALRLNPFDLVSTAAAFDVAMTLSPKERAARHARDLPYVLSRPSGKWTREILQDMQFGLMQQEIESRTQSQQRRTNKEILHTIGLDRKDTNEVSQVFIIDIDESLSGVSSDRVGLYIKQSMNFFPNNHLFMCYALTEALERTAQKCNNVLFSRTIPLKYLTLTSGIRSGTILASSSGLCLPRFVQESDRAHRVWYLFESSLDWNEVRSTALPILRWFTARTNGSSILKAHGLAWTYYRTDPEWGRIQASQLITELRSALDASQVFISHHEGGYVEILPKMDTTLLQILLELIMRHPKLVRNDAVENSNKFDHKENRCSLDAKLFSISRDNNRTKIFSSL
uniref:CBM20 domain-containing protein n=1 Tax=Aureoumbra lagunensis TaxID=44058 RepID=A0A7S3NPG5_9STRA|mmetsp:Transcript_16984/g.25568  ORF Transcript_16984/g.25568 Transcript_16984/m.25568 type:complete len:928 (-) Transcript_16984:467-3250(-)